MVLKSCRKIFGKGLQLGLAALLVGALVPMAYAAEQAAPAAQAAAPEVAPAEAAPVEAAPAEPGNAAVGKLLFTGEQSFASGAPPCMSCHSAGVGVLGGGALGPDLTKTYADPSKNPLINAAWINNPAPDRGGLLK